MKQAHIQLDKLGIHYALLPGDPARLDAIKNYLEDVEELAYHREFRSLRGRYKGIDVLAVSTGIGGSSAAIAIEELLQIGVNVFVRIGSAGGLQSEIKVGDLLLIEGAIRDEGTSKAYVESEYPAVASLDLLRHADTICQEKNIPYHVGIVHSHESFYIDNNQAIEERYSHLGVLGADMETAALYTVARLRKAKALSILNNVVQYGESTEKAIASYVDGFSLSQLGEKREIEIALEVISRYDKEKK